MLMLHIHTRKNVVFCEDFLIVFQLAIFFIVNQKHNSALKHRAKQLPSVSFKMFHCRYIETGFHFWSIPAD